MTTLLRRSILTLAAISVLSSSSFAQDAKPAPAQPAQGAASKPKSPDDYPAFDEVTKDMEAVPGLMTFYRYKESDVTKDQTKLLCVVPKSLLKQDLLFAANFSRGNLAGFQWQDGLVRWEQVGRQIKLVAPDTRVADKPGSPITEAVERTYRPSFVFALPIVTLTPQGDAVIDLGQALFSQAPLVANPNGGGQVRREISRLDSVRSFPDNALIDVDLSVSDGRSSIGGTTYGVSYAFRRLPDVKAYKSRVADERVGYFTTDRQDWTTKYSEREMIERFVTRWDLKKKDPTLDLSPPEKPITFIVEKSVPLQWRRFVADGILEWNKAYEKVGIVGAIVVQQQTDDNEFAGIDPADARYNFIQWTVRNSVMAMGPSRPDPRTGQILDADIVIDDSWIRHFNESSEIFAPKALAAMMGPDTLKFFEENPSYLPPGMSIEQVKAARATIGAELMQSKASGSSMADAPSMFPLSQRQCEMAMGLVQQMSLAQLVGQQAKSKGLPKIPDHLIGSALKHIVMHEVGHTLGLRHNFKASSWLTMDQIKAARDKGEPFVASVMDYTPLAFYDNDDLTKVRSFASDTIGPYDAWAIEYGYGTPKDGDKEADYLKKITSRSTERELAYGTDEDTMGLISPDPLANRYDLSSDPTAWAANQIELTSKLLSNVRDWASTADEPNHYLRTAYVELMYERSRNLTYVARQVGGQYFSRSRASDPKAPLPLTLVDPKQQRAALDLISKTVFTEKFYDADPELLNRLTPPRWWQWGDFPSSRVDFPYQQFVQSQYGYTLFTLSAPQVLQRVYDAEVKTASPDKLTATELIRTVRDSIWGELKRDNFDGITDAKPAISTIRRNMQNAHLQYLLATAESEPGRVVSSDLRNITRYALRELSESIASGLKAGGQKLDFATRAHLTEARSRIDRTLDKPIVDVGSRGAIIILQEGQDAAK